MNQTNNRIREEWRQTVRETFHLVSRQALDFDEHQSVIDYRTATETSIKLIAELLKSQKEDICLKIAEYSGINDIQTKELLFLIKQ